MLVRSFARRAAGAARALPPAAFVRFQTTGPAPETTAPNTKSSAQHTKTAQDTKAAQNTNLAAAANPAAGTPAQAAAPKKYQYHRKLFDIVKQVEKLVAGVPDASSPALAEAIDIFEEGAAYLREIQQAEGIADDAFYSIFQPVLARLFDLVVAENASLGSRSVETVLDMMVEQRVAHTYHFVAVQKRVLQNTADPDAYPRVLQLWIMFLDYAKRMAATAAGRLVRGNYGVYRDRDYRLTDLLRLAYFALISHCLRTGEEYDLATTVKILQVADAQEIPPLYFVTSTLARLGLRDALGDEIRAFAKKVSEQDANNMDPNGAAVSRQIDVLLRLASPVGLRKLYGEMKASSTRNAIAISEQTLNHVMSAFIAMKLFDDALAIFAAICGGLVPKPSPASWELALKALGHPSHVARMLPPEKTAVLDKIEATFRAMVASGVRVNAKVLGVLLGGLATLDRQDLVAKYMAEHKDVPIVHMARNNILVGMAVNKQLAEAETRMRAYLEEDPSFVPSTSVMNTFLAHYVATGNDSAVAGILDFMAQKGIEENIATITTVLNYYFKTYRDKGMVPNVRELIGDVIKDTSKWDQHMVATLIDGLVRDGVNMEAARGVFKYFCETRARFKHSAGMLTSMIKAEMEFGSVHNAEDLFAWYVKNLRNDTMLYNMMIRGLLTKRESLALKYYSDLCAQRPFGVAPNFYTYFFLIDHFMKKRDRTRIQWVLDELAAADLTSFGRNLPQIIRNLAREYKVSPELMASLAGAA
ncbi:hypothetical protein METBIDRAFT_10186 [Metschnikowia bicuspidata var. bicuspidata NRRL YB-4993]|uniref:Mitochondrial group I intron splicing factor CCM1 n=1 Tax=Metschnikowia bicuspidata var. bicuspidata NRRL YB-4993 TaxID=869754 RepID=A0A1A0HIK9_9ASCO|nr:hypothetical protein METBIDRAFT_10186 [Metschnikowia bicuspidata var. bicuspidata NRRL YB-4993]OBA23989.1 hypothetical protein METBIDRAFT_10186 [Metschnikowia bicuspidata var. bicuspidata NRRL YB-4993]